MAISLYAATIPSCQQLLGAVDALLDKAQAFCAEKGIAEEEMIEARLIEDMLPFAYQVRATATHSIGAIEGIRKGTFSPDRSPWPESFAELKQLVAETRSALAALDPAEIDGFEGRPMAFELPGLRADFTAENFLLSFSQPNFYFHATTAYDIMRMKGVQIGKRDFMGVWRTV
nr:K851 [uncultured bacterium]